MHPWQWPEEHWRKLVNQVRAGRSFRPKTWKGGARYAVALSFDSDHETSELRDDVKKRLAALEGYMKAEIESLSDRLRAEQDARGGAAKDLARELHDTAQQFGQKTAQLDDAIARSTRDFREQLHAQRQELSDDIRQRIEDVLARLARETSELRSDKADRSALAALLTEMAMRLNGDLRATALEAEVRG